MPYTKQWKSFDEQLDQLIDRGMVVTDRELALDYLDRIGYYRLSGYWYAFRKRESGQVLDAFKEGATFQNAIELYVFDKKLRILVLDALERIEVGIRVDVSYILGELDPFAYLKPDLFHTSFGVELDLGKGVSKLHEWQTKQATLISRSKEEFVKHNKTKYGLPLAIWVACEVWDFGTLSTLFSGMRESEQDAIASRYGIRNGRTFATWLRSMNYLRNVCAHHSRLWNRNIVDQPKLPAADQLSWVAPFEADARLRARCFLLLLIARDLLRVINPNSTWQARMKEHLMGFPDLDHLDLNLGRMGAPANWQQEWS